MIYLDNNATTKLDASVLSEMVREYQGDPANPSSPHTYGKKAYCLLQKARQEVATFFRVRSSEVIFTSGGTEAVNLFLRGIEKKGQIISTKIEHSCIDKTLALDNQHVTYVPVGSWGAPQTKDIENAITSKTSAIVLSASNSETGVKIDYESIGEVARKYDIPLFIDAVALIGKEPFVMVPGISAIAISAHKFHGPKGAGALICRKKIIPQMTGGPQEHMKRAGTENLAGILGLAKAIQILKVDQEKISKELRDLRTLFEAELQRNLPQILINGEGPRVSNTVNIAFEGVDAETLLIQLDLNGIAASHGSACSSGSMEPSRVLIQMGLDPKRVRSSIRFSLSRLNTKEEIINAVQKISFIVNNLRG